MSEGAASAEKTIFVNNINYNTNEDELKEAFRQFGNVSSARIIKDRFRGGFRSRGIGFVDFDTVDSARAAVGAQTIPLAGRTLRITQARPKVNYPRLTLFVLGIPTDTTQQDIKSLFPGKEITEVKIIKYNSETSRGFAFVNFVSQEVCEAAKNASINSQLQGKEVIVKYARPRRTNTFSQRRYYSKGPMRRAVRRPPPAATEPAPK
uniref:RNA-binding protein n=1 Tax=Coptotermes formosanus TaxID=36987 RepID=R4UV42_COPFO|nr:RNA-binding protein [Coptotermes formosanus]